MIDATTFLLIVIYILCSILITTLIVLVIKLINTVNRVNKMLNEIDNKINKFEPLFNIVDILTDNMALISDKIVDGVSSAIRKIFIKKRKDESNE